MLFFGQLKELVEYLALARYTFTLVAVALPWNTLLMKVICATKKKGHQKKKKKTQLKFLVNNTQSITSYLLNQVSEIAFGSLVVLVAQFVIFYVLFVFFSLGCYGCRCVVIVIVVCIIKTKQ